MSSSPESEITSIFSPPATRATSTTSRYSDTSDKVFSGYPSRNGMIGPRTMGRVQTTSTLLQSRANSHVTVTRQRPFAPEPQLLHRNKSTKQLINKFESLTKPHTSTVIHAGQLEESQRTIFKPKAANPLRRSFRNLLTAFSKKLKPQVREKPSPSPSVSKELPSPPSASANPIPPYTHTSYQNLASLADNPIISGTALYLSAHTFTENALPVWTECNLALYTTHILVTWHTTYGNPISHMIKLESCVDVKSIPLVELGELELALLPDVDRKAIHLSFEGAPQEKFLFPSISERARWVNSVW